MLLSNVTHGEMCELTQDKVQLFQDRMYLLLQRLKRNRNFSKPAFAGIKSNSREFVEVSTPLPGLACSNLPLHADANLGLFSHAAA